MIDSKRRDQGICFFFSLIVTAPWRQQRQELNESEEWLLLGDGNETGHERLDSSLVSTYRVIMEGYLEKKGHSTAFFMWPKCVGYLGLCVVCLPFSGVKCYDCDIAGAGWWSRKVRWPTTSQKTGRLVCSALSHYILHLYNGFLCVSLP